MKYFRIVLLSVILLSLLCVCAVGAKEYITERKNENNLNVLMSVFTDVISEYPNVDIVETKGTYGKLNGNGNGIQYFGAALVSAESIEDMEAITSALKQKLEISEYCKQMNKDIQAKYLEHKDLGYDFDFSGDTEYYTIYFYNSKYPDSDLSDVAGH